MFPSPPPLLRYTIAVEVWRGVRDRYGDIVRVLDHVIDGCVMAPRYSNEVTDNRTTVIVGFTLFGPSGSDIRADDQVKAPDGNVYNVVGEAVSWESPLTGWKPGFEAALERVK